jgi:hypothetical protein
MALFNAGLTTQKMPLRFVASLDPTVLAFVVALTVLSTVGA